MQIVRQWFVGIDQGRAEREAAIACGAQHGAHLRVLQAYTVGQFSGAVCRVLVEWQRPRRA